MFHVISHQGNGKYTMARCHLTPSRTAVAKQTENSKVQRKKQNRRILLALKRQLAWNTVWQFFKLLNMRLQHYLADSLLGICLREIKQMSKCNLYARIHSGIINNKRGNIAKVCQSPNTARWNGGLPAGKRNETTNAETVEPWKLANWKKPRDQVLHDYISIKCEE